jgi:hypothetical protein
MKTVIASVLAAGLAASGLVAPAIAQTAPKTELVSLEGKHVDTMLLRYSFDASWVVDRQHILMRDTYLDHYVVSLKAPCTWLDQSTFKGFFFFPALNGNLRAGRAYEVRNEGHEPCIISGVQQVPSTQATELKSKVAQKG